MQHLSCAGAVGLDMHHEWRPLFHLDKKRKKKKEKERENTNYRIPKILINYTLLFLTLIYEKND